MRNFIRKHEVSMFCHIMIFCLHFSFPSCLVLSYTANSVAAIEISWVTIILFYYKKHPNILFQLFSAWILLNRLKNIYKPRCIHKLLWNSKFEVIMNYRINYHFIRRNIGSAWEQAARCNSNFSITLYFENTVISNLLTSRLRSVN